MCYVVELLLVCSVLYILLITFVSVSFVFVRNVASTNNNVSKALSPLVGILYRKKKVMRF